MQNLCLNDKDMVTIIERTQNVIDFNKYCRKIGNVPSWVPNFLEIDILYDTTTENISEYSKYFKKPESVLTVCGSGDHVLNALAIGATDITSFDINLLAYFALELKLAAIKVFTPGEYFVFYEKFPYNLFERLFPVMSDPARTYWYNVLDYAKENIGLDLFAYETVPKEISKRINLFGDKKVYCQLKEQASIANFSFIHADIYDIKALVGDKKFDIINFSNIYEYLNKNLSFLLENTIRYHEYIMNLAMNNLNDQGQILVSYFYNYNFKVKEYVDRLLKKSPNTLYVGGDITPLNIHTFNNGFTIQKVAYNYLLDSFNGEIDCHLVSAVGNYGESFDKSNDMALIYTKK